MSKRRKPFDPASATEAALQRREREQEVRRLQGQGATVTTDRTGRVVSAYRSNVFNLLLSRGTIDQGQYQAAADLCELWAIWRGLDGKPDMAGEMVDNGRAAPDKRCLVNDRMVKAGKDVTDLLSHLSIQSCVLIERLVSDTVEEDRPRVWRVQVTEALGITIRERQTEAVKSALAELVALKQLPQERKAA